MWAIAPLIGLMVYTFARVGAALGNRSKISMCKTVEPGYGYMKKAESSMKCPVITTLMNTCTLVVESFVIVRKISNIDRTCFFRCQNRSYYHPDRWARCGHFAAYCYRSLWGGGCGEIFSQPLGHSLT